MWNDVRTDIYVRLIEAAIGGHTIAYSDVLPNAPRQVGPHLYPIADYEKAHRRPPLTALVVHKQGRRPGEGFATVADHITYRRPGESDRDVWERACADCHSNQTQWPWYTTLAPGSWLTAVHVNAGRDRFNVSAMSSFARGGGEAAQQVRSGAMPLADYMLIHPTARLTDAEKQALIQGLQKSLGQ